MVRLRVPMLHLSGTGWQEARYSYEGEHSVGMLVSSWAGLSVIVLYELTGSVMCGKWEGC